MASVVVRRLSEATKERLRRRAVRHQRSLEAEVRAILERAAQETELPSAEAERFPDWFIRMTRPGIDLDAAVATTRTAGLPSSIAERAVLKIAPPMILS